MLVWFKSQSHRPDLREKQLGERLFVFEGSRSFEPESVDLPNYDRRPGAPSRDPQGVTTAAQVGEVAEPELQPAVLRARDPVRDRMPASQQPPVNPRLRGLLHQDDLAGDLHFLGAL